MSENQKRDKHLYGAPSCRPSQAGEARECVAPLNRLGSLTPDATRRLASILGVSIPIVCGKRMPARLA
jgi:hypothetical protein